MATAELTPAEMMRAMATVIDANPRLASQLSQQTGSTPNGKLSQQTQPTAGSQLPDRSDLKPMGLVTKDTGDVHINGDPDWHMETQVSIEDSGELLGFTHSWTTGPYPWSPGFHGTMFRVPAATLDSRSSPPGMRAAITASGSSAGRVAV
jgi:hypothetical protein